MYDVFKLLFNLNYAITWETINWCAGKYRMNKLGQKTQQIPSYYNNAVSDLIQRNDVIASRDSILFSGKKRSTLRNNNCSLRALLLIKIKENGICVAGLTGIFFYTILLLRWFKLFLSILRQYCPLFNWNSEYVSY